MSKRIWRQIWGRKSGLMKKFIKSKSSGTPKSCRADQVKFKIWGHFGRQKGDKRKIAQNFTIVFDDFWLKFLFYTIFSILKKELKIVPTTTTSTVPWSRLRLRQKMNRQRTHATEKKSERIEESTFLTTFAAGLFGFPPLFLIWVKDKRPFVPKHICYCYKQMGNSQKLFWAIYDILTCQLVSPFR